MPTRATLLSLLCIGLLGAAEPMAEPIDLLLGFLTPGLAKAEVDAAIARSGHGRWRSLSSTLALGDEPSAELIRITPWDHLELRYDASHDPKGLGNLDPRDRLLEARRHRFADLLTGRPADEVEALMAIQAVSSIGRYAVDPVRLVRCVNLLRGRGEARAHDLLVAYLALLAPAADADPARWFRLVWADDLDEQRVILIARTLYGQLDEGRSLPLPALGAASPPLPATGPGRQILPLYLWQDLPVLLVTGYTLAGHAEPAAMHLETCRARGVFRNGDLVPPADPLRAVDALLASPRWTELYPDPGTAAEMAAFLRRQAWDGLAETVPELLDLDDPGEGPSAAAWAAGLAATARAGLSWDGAAQRYMRQR
jgi:hypothetical protein